MWTTDEQRAEVRRQAPGLIQTSLVKCSLQSLQQSDVSRMLLRYNQVSTNEVRCGLITMSWSISRACERMQLSCQQQYRVLIRTLVCLHLASTAPGWFENKCWNLFSFLWLQTVEFLVNCVYVSICCLVLVTQSLGCIHSSRFALFCVVKATLVVLENLKLWKSQHFSFTMSTALKLSAICVAVRSCVARNRGHLWGQFPNQQSIRLCCKENTTQTSKIFQITFQVCRNNRLVQFRCKFILVCIF